MEGRPVEPIELNNSHRAAVGYMDFHKTIFIRQSSKRSLFSACYENVTLSSVSAMQSSAFDIAADFFTARSFIFEVQSL